MTPTGKTPSSLRLTEISQNETTDLQVLMHLLLSPEIVTAFAIAGDLTFNPLTDTLINEDGQVGEAGRTDRVMNCRQRDFLLMTPDIRLLQKMAVQCKVVVKPDSQRLQLLEPFPAWEGTDIDGT